MLNYNCKYCKDTGQTTLLYSRVPCLECDKGRHLFSCQDSDENDTNKKHFTMPMEATYILGSFTNCSGAILTGDELCHTKEPMYSGVFKVDTPLKAGDIVSIEGNKVCRGGTPFGVVFNEPDGHELLAHKDDPGIHYTDKAAKKIDGWLRTSFIDHIAYLHRIGAKGLPGRIMQHWSLEGAKVEDLIVDIHSSESLDGRTQTTLNICIIPMNILGEHNDSFNIFSQHLYDESLTINTRGVMSHSVTCDFPMRSVGHSSLKAEWLPLCGNINIEICIND